MRRAAKKDANHQEIVSALLRLGFSVMDTAAVGQGFPDLVVARAGVNFLVEIKDGGKPPSARRLTRDQIEFHSRWASRIVMLYSVEEAVQFANTL